MFLNGLVFSTPVDFRITNLGKISGAILNDRSAPIVDHSSGSNKVMRMALQDDKMDMLRIKETCPAASHEGQTMKQPGALNQESESMGASWCAVSIAVHGHLMQGRVK